MASIETFLFLRVEHTFLMTPIGEEPKMCAMCNRQFDAGEPEYLWGGKDFCTEGCMDEYISMVMA
jgi:hypothetical protein